MFKEILQIIPKLSAGDLSKMERSLSSRFSSVAKKFGKGLMAAITGGGITAAALSLIDKLVNPLKATQEAIDRVLSQSDDLVTNAKQFGTTAGKLFRLQQLGKSTGLEEGSLNLLLEKFQTSVAEAAADPEKQTSVRQFVGEKDTAEAFFQFIQALQKMDKTQQVLVQQEIFGEKQILKMADFLQTDFASQSKLVGGPSAEALTPGLQKLGDLNDLKDILKARQTLDDTLAKSKTITADMVRSQSEQEKRELARENQNISNYENLAKIAETADNISKIASDTSLGVAGLVSKMDSVNSSLKKLADSNIARGLIKYFANGLHK